MQMKKDLDDIEIVSDSVIQLDVVGAQPICLSVLSLYLSLSLSQTHTHTHTHSPLMFFSRFTPAYLLAPLFQMMHSLWNLSSKR
jgi:hypothetical protein